MSNGVRVVCVYLLSKSLCTEYLCTEYKENCYPSLVKASISSLNSLLQVKASISLDSLLQVKASIEVPSRTCLVLGVPLSDGRRDGGSMMLSVGSCIRL